MLCCMLGMKKLEEGKSLGMGGGEGGAHVRRERTPRIAQVC
jgi:hypothetical protein